MTFEKLIDVSLKIFGDKDWPLPLNLARGLHLVDSGKSVGTAAKEVKTTARNLDRLVRSSNRIRDLFDIDFAEIQPGQRERVTLILGQLTLGRCAEIVFEDIYKDEMHSKEFDLKDLRESRSDTDYRLYNGQGRPIYRINIKFHGSRFRRAAELVGLESGDCFALATYKIYSALLKQEQEGLPYFFTVVGVPSLSGKIIGAQIPEEILNLSVLYASSRRPTKKRDYEDTVVRYLISENSDVVQRTLAEIKRADWYMLSARRADNLLRQYLFERVFALRIRGFAQQFRGAELDMHFSLKKDLIPLQQFLKLLRESGQTKVTTLMERGQL